MDWLYDNPETMNYDTIDEPIRDLVRTINDSDWLRTEESCCGHPANEGTAWGHVPELYLRLVTNDMRRLLFMVDRLRESFKSLLGHVSLSYDRVDALGVHWFLLCKYNTFSNRTLAIQFVEIVFNDASVGWMTSE